MSNSLTEFGQKLIELSSVLPHDEVYSTLISAIDAKLSSTGSKKDLARVKQIQFQVEKHYGLQQDALVDSFKVKNPDLTEPKLVWVMVCLYVFNGDRSEVKKFLRNGITTQKMYTCNRDFKALSDNVPHEKKIKEIYNIIIKSYE